MKLKEIFQNKELSHGYLLVGRIDAQEIQKLLKVSLSDFNVIKSAEIKIKEIRDLIHWLNLKPHSSKLKLAIIEDAENLNIASANALLKTLEEPPASSVIILTTLNPQKILPTISSRLRKVRLAYSLAQEEPEGYLDPAALGRLSLPERFKWVNQVYERKDLILFFNLWLDWYRQRLQSKKETQIIKEILFSKDLLSTNISVKLLLENLVIGFENDKEK